MRSKRPFAFTKANDGVGLERIISFMLERRMLPERRLEKLLKPPEHTDVTIEMSQRYSRETTQPNRIDSQPQALRGGIRDMGL